MDIQAIGSRAFSVYIQESELLSRHLAAGTLTARDARTLVAPLIGSDGLGAVNLELYPGRHEVLIFVSRSSGEPPPPQNTDSYLPAKALPKPSSNMELDRTMMGSLP